MNMLLTLASTVAESNPIPSVMQIIESVLMLLSGLGVFLFGIKIMGDNLETVAGSKMRGLFDKISGNRFTGVLTGTAVTTVIQSSSATTVMVVGFVNAGLMTLVQAAPIIMGANIGTTITAWLASLSGFGVTAWFAALAAVGAFMMMSKKDILKKVGAILTGLGMVFVGLDVMSTSMGFIGELDAVVELFKVVDNGILLLIIGALFTALVQSSSAATAIFLVMAASNILSIDQVMFATLGANIGTCITAVLASIGASTNAKRASIIHLLFNVTGALIFLPIVAYAPMNVMLEAMFPDAVETQVAMFHTIFNITNTLIMLPFVKVLVWIAEHVLPERKNKNNADEEFVTNKLKFIDERILSTPTIAMNQTKREILLMANVAKKNFKLAVESVLEGKPINKEKFEARESHINFLNRQIPNYIVKLSASDISFKDEMMIASYYHVVSDVERIGDYAENIIEYSQALKDIKTTFSDSAKAQIINMVEEIHKVYENAIVAFERLDYQALELACDHENIVDDMKRTLDIDHIKRLNNSKCSADTGAIYLSLVSNLERISDHMQNVALSIKSYTNPPKRVYAIIK